LYVADNWGGDGIAVREASLRGPDDTVVSVDFAVVGDGAWRTVSLPLHAAFRGTLRQVRLHPALGGGGVRGGSGAAATEAALGPSLDAPPPTKGNAFAIDWIRVVVAPTIMRVEGCQVKRKRASDRQRKKDGKLSTHSMYFYLNSSPSSCL
jgi:hypothetical protein